ncbi:hypothetical protein KR093_010559 [Drosophila rubida]|uniref:Uncharacterized protein n=1 Tax=Drosophila rubida TaxID=30044 RepID=A0AAD4PMF0_9MUSC|nr:hypothetical protein KR093_010559 [Drosophila rubida]
MYECCAPNCCDPCYKICTPPDCSLTTEFPKQTGPFVEEKFSNYNPPSFLVNRSPPKTRAKSRSCSCFTKSAKVSPNCKCKSKGISDCKKVDRESGKRVCDKSCDAKSDNDSEAAGNGSIPSKSNSDNNLGMPGQRQGPEDAWPLPDPVIPVYDFRDALNPMNQVPRPLKEMPAAGLPTRKDPMFDPCTGVECQPTPPQNGAYGAPLNYMYPNCYPSPYYSMPYCGIPCCPCPQDMNMQGPMPSQQPDNVNEPGETAVEATKSTSVERLKKSRNERSKSKKDDLSNEKERGKEKANKSKLQNNQAMKLVKCNEIGKDLIDRICKSLQIPRPPVDCYIVLPIPMAVKSKAKSSPSESKKGTDSSGGPDSSSGENKDATSSQNEKQSPSSSEQCKTRNCGCNTMISGKFDDSSENSEASSKDKDKGKDKENKDGDGACCSTGGCYYRPRYKYCYNPCTGCFYWRKQCCCCNGCCGNGGGGNSCPIPKQASKSDSGSPQASTKKKGESSKSKVSMDSKRSKAGAMCSFQPGVQDPFNPWLGFQQQCSAVPPFYYRSNRVFPPQFQMNGRRFASQPHNQNGRQHRSVDIDWRSY